MWLRRTFSSVILLRMASTRFSVSEIAFSCAEVTYGKLLSTLPSEIHSMLMSAEDLMCDSEQNRAFVLVSGVKRTPQIL